MYATPRPSSNLAKGQHGFPSVSWVLRLNTCQVYCKVYPAPDGLTHPVHLCPCLVQSCIDIDLEISGLQGTVRKTKLDVDQKLSFYMSAYKHDWFISIAPSKIILMGKLVSELTILPWVFFKLRDWTQKINIEASLKAGASFLSGPKFNFLLGIPWRFNIYALSLI